jgi:hypothetical protein
MCPGLNVQKTCGKTEMDSRGFSFFPITPFPYLLFSTSTQSCLSGVSARHIIQFP